MIKFHQTQHSHQPDISLVILCYKAGESVREFVREVIIEFQKNDIDNYELVLVGNYHKGSDDVTPKVVVEIASSNSRIVYVARPKEGMMGWDMKMGLDISSGSYIGVIDGDGQVLILDIVKVYEKIKQGNHDLVKTYRISRGDGAKRRIISLIFNSLVRFLFPGILSCDINAKPKIFTRSAYEKFKLQSDDWFIDTETMIQAPRHGLRIAEIPTKFLGLSGRESFIRPSALVEFLINLIKYQIKEHQVKKNTGL